MDWTILLQTLAPFIGTLVTALIKAVLPHVPKLAMPILSTAVGAIAAALGGADVQTSIALGGASVAVREVVDQGKKAGVNALAIILTAMSVGFGACAPLVTKDATTGKVTVDPVWSSALQATAASTAAMACREAPAGDRYAVAQYLHSIELQLQQDPGQALIDLAKRPPATSPQDLLPFAFAWTWSAINSTLTNPGVQDPELWFALELPIAKAAVRGCICGLGGCGSAA